MAGTSTMAMPFGRSETYARWPSSRNTVQIGAFAKDRLLTTVQSSAALVDNHFDQLLISDLSHEEDRAVRRRLRLVSQNAAQVERSDQLAIVRSQDIEIAVAHARHIGDVARWRERRDVRPGTHRQQQRLDRRALTVHDEEPVRSLARHP
jgi:hypothetical protein